MDLHGPRGSIVRAACVSNVSGVAESFVELRERQRGEVVVDDRSLDVVGADLCLACHTNFEVSMASVKFTLWRRDNKVPPALVLASDAFFPFRDGIDQAAEAGVQAIVQPGGSVRDEEVIAAADEHGITMVLTGQRQFRH